ncbi:MAG: carboxypeptidase-like regulatory domain-containing protein, partial [Mediterranea sp.]|nr:carboxypeptidase-like regulatory domain-containing protein [Mediterranea sp.]
PFSTIKGSLSDNDTGKPIPYVSVGISNTTIGTVSNQDGIFQLTLPDSLRQQKVRFSHIGYESMELTLPEGENMDLALKPQVVSLQEIIVKYTPPAQLLREMLNHRPVNYSSIPVCLTSFYREGIEHRRRNIDLTESILLIYKTGYDKDATNDQTKLIKKRRFVNRQQTDTIFPKMRSGVNSCLVLDIMKELPEFIDPDSEPSYTYTHKGVDIIDDRVVNIIRFRQREHIKEPLYKGELYIEKESKALVEIRFEINPSLAGRATHMFVDKKPAGLKIDLRYARYIVSYKPSEDGIYYINHIRGDIGFKVRRRKRLFSSPLNFWFEMATCKVDTTDVQPFPRNERLSPTRIFAETRHGYDKDFWENFNILLPEEELKEDMIRHLNEILVTVK